MEGWINVGEKGGVTIYKKEQEGIPINCMKGVGIIHASPESIFNLIGDLKLVSKWDRMSDDVHVVKKIDEKTSIVYMSSKGKFPVAPRDFCIVAARRDQPDGTIIQLSKSTLDDSVPTVSGKVRAELLTSGFVIKPTKINGYREIGSLVTYVVQFDPKGWLPTFIANRIAEYQPLRIAKIRQLLPEQEFTHTPPEVTVEHFLKQPIEQQIDTRSTIDGDSDEDYKDPATDFSAFGIDSSAKDEIRSCLSVLQNQVMYLQMSVDRSQAHLQLLEKKVQLHLPTSIIQKEPQRMEEYTTNRGWWTRFLILGGRKRFIIILLLMVWPFISLRIYGWSKNWLKQRRFIQR